MNHKNFTQLRRDLDEAITYGEIDTVDKIVEEGLERALKEEVMGEIMYFRAQNEILNENYENAIQCLNQAIVYNPKDGAAYNDRALCGLELDADEDETIADFNKGIEVEPDYANIHHNKGWYLNQIGDHEEALICFERALELEPHRAVTYENIADTYLNLGNKLKAIQAYGQAIHCLNPLYTEIKAEIEEKIQFLLEEDD